MSRTVCLWSIINSNLIVRFCVAVIFSSSRAHRHLCVCRALAQVMRTTSSRSVSLVVGSTVELAALHHDLTVDPLRWVFCFRDGEALAFLGCRVPAVAGTDPNLVHGWNQRPIEFLGGEAATEELAIKIQSNVDAHSDPGHVSCSHSRFYTASR